MLTNLLRKRAPGSAVREGFAQVVGAVPAVVALMDRDLAAYHGIEHKAIAAYEQGVEDVAAVPKEHDRCGSNLLVPMMLLSAGGTVLLERLVAEPNAVARAPPRITRPADFASLIRSLRPSGDFRLYRGPVCDD